MGLTRWRRPEGTHLPMQETLEMQFDPWVGKIPGERAWQPTLVFLPGESHGQRSLSYRELGTMEGTLSTQS